MPVVGEEVCGSKVLRDLGVKAEDPKKGHWFEITCGHCHTPQLRTAGQINFVFRRGFSVTCPRCVKEGFAVLHLQRSDAITERVLGGGPSYTYGETLAMCEDVLAALEAEFGPPRDPDDEMGPDDFRPAAGFPYSHGDVSRAKEALEKFHVDPAARRADPEWIGIMVRERAEADEREYQEALARAREVAASRAKERIRAVSAALARHGSREHARSQQLFREHAASAAEALVGFVQVGGSIDGDDDGENGENEET